ncbi:MAG: bifunctional (p)ppGpp synthetase/guanosine-3',5'-bis(diphosphate) 3'-pyrophosphohydrolase [Deltaproteobacteria bacterium]|nr:bifunctional (p)ppGpp synthetase/guanosine-3',5'-bis(diphosphate) 3'-pyrophosphohydrolase [Deltaproteobacteria bacterium]
MLKLEHILADLREYHPRADVDLIKAAYLFAFEKHGGQKRASGEPYIIHPLNVAQIVTSLKLDEEAVAAALLHDVVEDTDVTQADVTERFGARVAVLVDGVTKLSKMSFSSHEERQAENFRKMMMAMSKDIRVILVKLADRLHNMQTLDYKARQPGGLESAQRIARETMEIYAPLANRLGIHAIKSQLEDLSFQYLQPEEWNTLSKQLARLKREHQRFIDLVNGILGNELKAAGYKAEIHGRMKHLYSIWRKMQAQHIPVEEIYDLVAFRVLVEQVNECWHILGIVHQLWKPIPGRFRDYIDLPKPNGYRSLHTSVIGPNGEPMEVQIRTREMHEQAERGIAAHWRYKDSGPVARPDEERIKMLKDLLEGIRELHKDIDSSREFLSSVKEDLFGDEIFVFTPKGDVFVFPRGATPVDFAYAIHSEVGYHCTGAKVNGTMVPLSYPLHSGDIVQILTSPSQSPGSDWLKFVRTSRAKSKIRAVLRTERRGRSLEIGRALLEKELRRRGLSYGRLQKKGEIARAATELRAESEEDLLVRLGSSKVSLDALTAVLVPGEAPSPSPAQEQETRPTGITGLLNRILPDVATGRVLVGGEGDIMTHFARCCSPLPGDDIVGYVNRARGITVHRRDCRQVEGVEPDRLVDVAWDRRVKGERVVRLRVLCQDQQGMLAAMTQTLTNQSANIVSANCRGDKENGAVNVFEILVTSAGHLKTVMRALERIPGVRSVQRS